MPEFTKGPWRARELLPDGYIIKRTGTFEIHTPEYEVAGNVPCGAPFRKEADAVLAAAAPELLEALQEYERVRQASWRGLHKAAMKAQAAIAKATGGEHG